MSSPGHGHGPSPSSPDEDGIDIQKVILVGVGSLVVFALSAVVAYFILRHDSAQYDAAGRPPPPALIGKDEIGIIDTPDFATDRRLEQWQAARHKRLHSYGWVDQKKGVIHIPIDKAMDQVLGETSTGHQQ